MLHVLMISDSSIRSGACLSMLQMSDEINRLSGGQVKFSYILHRNVARDLNESRSNRRIVQVTYEQYNQVYPQDRWKTPAKWTVRGIQYLTGRIIAAHQIEQQLDLEAIDIVHTNTSRVDLGADLANRYDIPHIWHLREYFNLDYRCWSYRSDFVKLMNQAACLPCVSENLRKHWISMGVSEGIATTIYNGVPIPRQSQSMSERNEGDPLRLVICGTICEGKGQLELVEALGSLSPTLRKEVRLDFYGEGKGSYVQTVQKKVRELGLSDVVQFHGFHEDIQALLPFYDVGLMCSRSEAFGRVTAEYMMAGLAVIASDTGANPELVRDGTDGLLYQQGDPVSLAAAIAKLVVNRESVWKMGALGRERALALFSTERNARAIAAAYEDVLGLVPGTLLI